MDNTDLPLVQIEVRIPGTWAEPDELIERLPDGYGLSPRGLVTPSGQCLEVGFLPPDDQFVEVFATACRQNPTADEREAIENYAVIVTLGGPGGSLILASEFMRTAAALIAAGGSGVFVDNSAISHGGEAWTEMAEASPPTACDSEALSFAFTTVVGGRSRGYTHGMQVLGQPNLSMPPDAIGNNGEYIIDLVRQIAAGDYPKVAGAWTVWSGRQYDVRWQPDNDFQPGSPLHNPYGQLHLRPLDD